MKMFFPPFPHLSVVMGLAMIWLSLSFSSVLILRLAAAVALAISTLGVAGLTAGSGALPALGGGYSQLAVHDTYMIWQRNNKLGRVLAHIHGATEIRNYRSRFSKVFILDSGQQQHRSSPARIGCRI